MRHLRSDVRVLLLIVCLLFTPGMRADGDDLEHAWVVGIDPQSKSASLLHLPPRGGLVPDGAQWGMIRFAAPLSVAPEFVAWSGPDVWMVFAPDGHRAGVLSHPVLHLTATAAHITSNRRQWLNTPPDRPEVAASLVTDDDIIGVVGTRSGPAALILNRPSVSSAGGWSLRLLEKRSANWIDVELPWDGEQTEARRPAANALVHLLRWPSPPALSPSSSAGSSTSTPDAAMGLLVDEARNDGMGTLWIATISIGTVNRPTDSEKHSLGVSEPEISISVHWTSRPLRTARPAPPLNPPEAWDQRIQPGEVFAVGETVVSSRNLAHNGASGALYLWRHTESSCLLLHEEPSVPMETDVIPLPGAGGAGAAALLWGEGGQAEDPTSPGKTREVLTGDVIDREISIITGQVLYDGDARHASPVSRSDLAAMLWLLLVIAFGVVVYAGRQGAVGKDGIPLCPDGVSLAHPLTRLIASLIDIAIAMGIVGILTDVDVLTAVAPTTILRGGNDAVVPWLLIIGVAMVHGVAGEAMTGRTIGKLVTGCRVVRAAAGAERRPALWSCIIRNGCKFFLMPLTLIAFAASDGRHPGDMSARAWVAGAPPDEPESPPQ